MYPMKMRPAFKDYLWGGKRLALEYGKKTDMLRVAESWEVSCHPDGPSAAANGEFAGMPLRDILSQHPEYPGSACAGGAGLPVLVKLIDAKERLSVQVHPGDEYAFENERQRGKNEMWYVLDALPGAELVVGCKRPVGKEELARRIEDVTLLEILNHIEVKQGDCFEIPAGMLHAIGAGVIIAEVQQSSNVTYRVCDYGRRGADGSLRELHIRQALEVSDTGLKAKNGGKFAAVVEYGEYSAFQLTSWEYFSVKRLSIHIRANLACGVQSFHALLAVLGELKLEWRGGEFLPIQKGESVFIPAGMGEYSLVGNGEVLLVHV